ncbi:MAG TPA: hypothetical protein DCF33_16310 [Saprospirales bacterium]|nr:hypothetical protein [Saprospirales bacterium]
MPGDNTKPIHSPASNLGAKNEPAMNNSLKKLQDEREAMLPPELEDRISQHVGTLSLFSNVIEVFVPNALQVVVQMVGGEELPCLKKANRRQARANMDWRTPPSSTLPSPA